MQAALDLLLSESGLTTITATRRLSRRLLYEYNLQQSAGGLTAWPTPDILPWSAWIQRLWQSYALASHEKRVLLSATQSLNIWQDIIEQSSDDPLINLSATARYAQHARQRVIESELDLSNADIRQWFVYDADASRWLDWHQQYIAYLQRNEWLDMQHAVVQLTTQILQDELPLKSEHLTFAGFDGYTSQQQQLKAHFIQTGLYCELVDAGQPADTVYRVACKDRDAEFRQAARWAREQYEAGYESTRAPIGIIVPQLQRYRDEVERHLRDVFYPCDVMEDADDSLHTQGIRQNSIFNISLGHALIHQPVIRTALNILNLCRHRFDYDLFSAVIRSAYITGAERRVSQRSALDFGLRRRVGVNTGLQQLIAHMGANEYAEERQLLQQLETLKKGWHGAACASQWVARFQSALALFAWPGAAPVDNHQYQIHQALENLWLEFARQDLLQQQLSFEKALTLFNSLLASQIFQSGSAELPVQVLGMIEAAGMAFSSLWVMQMDEKNWPLPPNPNPFIPSRLQRECNMPGSTAYRQYDDAYRQTQRILHSAPEVLFSYAEYSDEEHISPSPLITGYQSYKPEPAADKQVKAALQQYAGEVEDSPFESLADDHGPQVGIEQYHATAGALKDQSHCPFRSFIRHRLRATSPEELQPGNDPAERGTRVHRVLEILWGQWQTSETLQSLDDRQLEQDVQAAIQQVMSSMSGPQDHDIEQRRLFAVVMEWLEQEQQRQPFTVIEREKEINAEMGGLKLRLVIDRIDRLADGSQCIIDYKTGAVHVSHWMGERPDEPQLPLYAAIQSEDIAAVAFAGIRAGECQYQGVTRDRELLVDYDKANSDKKALSGLQQIPVTRGNSALRQYDGWDAMLEEWRRTIASLAHAHRCGEAQVNPEEPRETTCRYCDIAPVCRVDLQQPDNQSVRDGS